MDLADCDVVYNGTAYLNPHIDRGLHGFTPTWHLVRHAVVLAQIYDRDIAQLLSSEIERKKHGTQPPATAATV